MAECGGQGVGHVGWVGQLGQAQFELDCPLHLTLFGPAGPGGDPLDLRGRIA